MPGADPGTRGPRPGAILVQSEAAPARERFPAADLYDAADGGDGRLAVYPVTDAYAAAAVHPHAGEASSSHTCELIADSGPAGPHAFLSIVAFRVPAHDERQFDDWYESEHGPRLLLARDWLRIRRYRVLRGEGGLWTHFALHELASLEVMDSPERAHARTGPRRDALAELPWFGQSGRWLYRLARAANRETA
jgi:hypothetical protein